MKYLQHLTALVYLISVNNRCLSVLCYTILVVVCIIRAVVFNISKHRYRIINKNASFIWLALRDKNSPSTGGFSFQRTSNAESVSMSRCCHALLPNQTSHQISWTISRSRLKTYNVRIIRNNSRFAHYNVTTKNSNRWSLTYRLHRNI